MPEEDFEEFKLLDWLVLVAFVAWLIFFYPFILLHSQEEIDSKHQTELLFYGFSFLVLTIYGGYAHHLGKHRSLKNKLVAAWIWMKDDSITFFVKVLRTFSSIAPILPSPVKAFARVLWGYLCRSKVHLIIDRLIYFNLILLILLAVFSLVLNKEGFTFCLQHLVLLAAHLFLTQACYTRHDARRLLNHSAYICAHLGYICEYLEYSESYFAIHIGFSCIVLNLVWYILNYPFQNERPGGGAPADRPGSDNPPGHPPGGDPPGDDPFFRGDRGDAPPENPPDDQSKPIKRQWKTPKSDKKRRKKGR